MAINIVVDGNFLFHSEYSIFTGYSKSPNAKPFSNVKKEADFIQGVANKLFYAINQLPKGGVVVFCIDSKSWRREFYPKYKESRMKPENQQMDPATKEKFYELMVEFCQLIKSVGIIVSRIPGAEGDDLLFRWANYFKASGSNTVLISGDSDMAQVATNSIEPWIITWNNNSKHNKIYTAWNWRENWLHNTANSIFEFSVADDREEMLKMVRTHALNIEQTHSQDLVLRKILLGDDGDDVPAVWSFIKKNKKMEDKEVRVTLKPTNQIIEHIKTECKLTIDTLMSKWGDPQFMDYLAGVILRVMGDVDGSAERLKVIDNLYRNAKLVWLTEASLPLNLVSSIDEHINLSMETIELKRNRWNRRGLLEGTRFDSVAPAKIDPFFNMTLPED